VEAAHISSEQMEEPVQAATAAWTEFFFACVAPWNRGGERDS